MVNSVNPLDMIRMTSRQNRVARPSGEGNPSFDSLVHEARRSDGKSKGTVDRRLMEASQELESLLVSKMLEQMRKSVPETGWIDGGRAEEIFEDMLYDEYAMEISRHGNLGLAKQIYDQMSRKL